jgi:LacI family transcriptional regulator
LSEHATGAPSGAASRRAGPTPRPTLKDVAAHAGVSVTTASFALTGRQDQRIAEETKQRVRAAAATLNYRPNLTPQILKTGRSGTIALVSDFVTSTPYASASIRGALEAARKHDALLYIAESLGDPDVERRLLESMIDRRVDGFVLASMFTHTVSVPEVLRDVPLVLLNCVTTDVDCPMVVPDERSAGVAAVRALLDAGHRGGMYFVGSLPRGMHGGPQWDGREALALVDRLHGIRAELRRAKLSLAGSLTVTDWEPADGRQAVSTLLATGALPTALICANDRIAFGAYQALAGAGLRVPDDVSVISFDDTELTRWLDPNLSSLELPHQEMGSRAVELLLAPSMTKGRHRVPMPCHLRESVGPPATASAAR